MASIEELKYLFYIGKIHIIEFKIFNTYCILKNVILRSQNYIGYNFNVGGQNKYFNVPYYSCVDVSSIKGYVNNAEVCTTSKLYYTSKTQIMFQSKIYLRLNSNFEGLILEYLTTKCPLAETVKLW